MMNQVALKTRLRDVIAEYEAKRSNVDKFVQEFEDAGDKLKSKLPATARYDHNIINGNWVDLPVGSFSDSGTNINTTILTKIKKCT